MDLDLCCDIDSLQSESHSTFAFGWAAAEFLPCARTCGARQLRVRPVMCIGYRNGVGTHAPEVFCSTPKPATVAECDDQGVGASCDDGMDGTVNDRCEAPKDSECRGRVALVSTLTFMIPIDDIRSGGDFIDRGALSDGIKQGLVPVMHGVGINCSLEDIAILRLAAGSLDIKYRVFAAVTPGHTTVSDAVRRAALEGITNAAFTIPAEATSSGNAISIPAESISAEPFFSYAFVKLEGCTASASCNIKCGQNSVISPVNNAPMSTYVPK